MGLLLDPEYTLTRDTLKDVVNNFRNKVRLQQESIPETQAVIKALEQIVVNQ